MAYDPSAVFTHRRYSHQRLDQIYREATKWQELTYIPYLLTRWQKDHVKDVIAISGYCSCKLGKHRLCNGEDHLYFTPQQIPIFKTEKPEVQTQTPVPTDVDTNNADNRL